MVRREHLELTYVRNKFDFEAIRQELLVQCRGNPKNFLSKEKGWRVFSFNDLSRDTWFCPREIHETWSPGLDVVSDARGPFNLMREEFIRDFNNSLDLIVVDRVDVAAFIVGTVWNPKCVVSRLHQTWF